MSTSESKPGPARTPTFSPFWPLFLVTVSMVIFLGWQVTQAAKQYVSSIRLADQQAYLTSQAAETEGKLQAMMMDLLKLSKTDADAMTIVQKYRITFNPVQQQTSSSMPDSAAKPLDATASAKEVTE